MLALVMLVHGQLRSQAAASCHDINDFRCCMANLHRIKYCRCQLERDSIAACHTSMPLVGALPRSGSRGISLDLLWFENQDVVCDAGCRNRHFRMLGCSKGGKPATLLPHPRYATRPGVSNGHLAGYNHHKTGWIRTGQKKNISRKTIQEPPLALREPRRVCMSLFMSDLFGNIIAMAELNQFAFATHCGLSKGSVQCFHAERQYAFTRIASLSTAVCQHDAIHWWQGAAAVRMTSALLSRHCLLMRQSPSSQADQAGRSIDCSLRCCSSSKCHRQRGLKSWSIKFQRAQRNL